MKKLVKLLNWIEWISAGIGGVFVILGLIQVLLRKRFGPSIEIINYFHAANSFFLLAIVLFLFIHLGQFKKE